MRVCHPPEERRWAAAEPSRASGRLEGIGGQGGGHSGRGSHRPRVDPQGGPTTGPRTKSETDPHGGRPSGCHQVATQGSNVTVATTTPTVVNGLFLHVKR